MRYKPLFVKSSILILLSLLFNTDISYSQSSKKPISVFLFEVEQNDEKSGTIEFALLNKDSLTIDSTIAFNQVGLYLNNDLFDQNNVFLKVDYYPTFLEQNHITIFVIPLNTIRLNNFIRIDSRYRFKQISKYHISKRKYQRQLNNNLPAPPRDPNAFVH